MTGESIPLRMRIRDASGAEIKDLGERSITVSEGRNFDLGAFNIGGLPEGRYRFVHDRVQEAAYSLIPETERAEMHLRIGRLLATHTPPERRSERIFEIVVQLNHGADLIESDVEREQLAELNLTAGRRAKSSTAYVSALGYLERGLALLSHDGWQRRPDLMFALELLAGECEFLTGALVSAEERLAALSTRPASSVDLASLASLRIDLYTALSRNDRAVEVCLGYLRELGSEIASHPTEDSAQAEYERTWSLIGCREIEDLASLPQTLDAEVVATMGVLGRGLSPALFTDANLLSVLVCRMTNLGLEHAIRGAGGRGGTGRRSGRYPNDPEERPVSLRPE